MKSSEKNIRGFHNKMASILLDPKEAWKKCCSEENVLFARRGTYEYEKVLERFKKYMKSQDSITVTVVDPKEPEKKIPQKRKISTVSKCDRQTKKQYVPTTTQTISRNSIGMKTFIQKTLNFEPIKSNQL